jgi:hypothetical protein
VERKLVMGLACVKMDFSYHRACLGRVAVGSIGIK